MPGAVRFFTMSYRRMYRRSAKSVNHEAASLWVWDAACYCWAGPERDQERTEERATCATSPSLLAPWVWCGCGLASGKPVKKQNRKLWSLWLVHIEEEEGAAEEKPEEQEEVLFLAGLLAELLPRGRLLGFWLWARVGAAVEGRHGAAFRVSVQAAVWGGVAALQLCGPLHLLQCSNCHNTHIRNVHSVTHRNINHTVSQERDGALK